MGSNANNALIAYSDGAFGVYAAMFGDSGLVDIGEISFGTRVKSINVTSDGNDFLVTWIADCFFCPNDSIAGRLIRSDGTPVGPTAGYSTGDTKGRLRTFWTGREYLAVWSTGRDHEGPQQIHGARIGRNGELLDYPPRVLGHFDGQEPAFAYSAGTLMVAYERDDRVYFRFIASGRPRSSRPPRS